jgi:hypothetical protein
MARRFSYSPTEAKLCPTPLGVRNYPSPPIFEQFRSFCSLRELGATVLYSLLGVDLGGGVAFVDSGAHWNRPEGFCALSAIRLGSRNFGLSLPHAANGCSKAAIRRDGVAGFGRSRP